MTEEEIRLLASSMGPHDVVIYTQPGCGYCDRAKRWLDEHGFSYVECDIRFDSGRAAEFRRFGATGTPYVVTSRGGRVRHLRNGFTSSAFLGSLSDE